MQFDTLTPIIQVLHNAGFNLGGGKKDHYFLTLTDSSGSGINGCDTIGIKPHDESNASRIAVILQIAGFANEITQCNVVRLSVLSATVRARALWKGQRRGFNIVI